MNAKFTVMTGGPGVGKTTILGVLVRAVEAMHRVHGPGRGNQKCKVLLCAPTGRAASRLQDANGATATTLHRLLHIQKDGSVKYNRNKRLHCDLVVVDEASAVLMYSVQWESDLVNGIPLANSGGAYPLLTEVVPPK